MYEKYSTLTPCIEGEFENSLFAQKRYNDCIKLQRKLEAPITNLKRYADVFKYILKSVLNVEEKDQDQMKLIATVAKTEIEVKSFVDRISKNYEFHTKVFNTRIIICNM